MQESSKSFRRRASFYALQTQKIRQNFFVKCSAFAIFIISTTEQNMTNLYVKTIAAQKAVPNDNAWFIKDEPHVAAYRAADAQLGKAIDPYITRYQNGEIASFELVDALAALIVQ